MSFLRQGKTRRRATNDPTIKTYHNIHSIQALDDYKKAKAITRNIPKEDEIIIVDDDGQQQYLNDNNNIETERPTYKPIPPDSIEENNKNIVMQSRCPLTEETFTNNNNISKHIIKILVLVIFIIILFRLYKLIPNAGQPEVRRGKDARPSYATTSQGY